MSVGTVLVPQLPRTLVKGRPIEKKSRVIVGVTMEVIKSRSITRLTFFCPTKKLTELLLEFLTELWGSRVFSSIG